MRSAWLLPTGQTRDDTRLAPVGAMTPAGELTTADGAVPGGDPFTAASAGAMDLQIGPGRAVVQGSTTAGAYPVVLDSPRTLTIADGDASYGRIDTVAIRVYDALFDASGQNAAAIEVIPGVPAPAPAPPALPAAAVRLWDVAVPAGASAGVGGLDWGTALSDRRSYTAAHGGITPAGWQNYDGAYAGQYRDTDGWLQRWDGAQWTDYPPRPAWQEWAPAWTTTGGAPLPSLGNAELKCRYLHDTITRTVHARLHIVFGSTTNFSSGGTGNNWRISLPLPAADDSACLGLVAMVASLDVRGIARARAAGTSHEHLELEVSGGKPDGTAVTNGGLVDRLSPWVWEEGHGLYGTLTYESAS